MNVSFPLEIEKFATPVALTLSFRPVFYIFASPSLDVSVSAGLLPEAAATQWTLVCSNIFVLTGPLMPA
jgi:hypothetical protein